MVLISKSIHKTNCFSLLNEFIFSFYLAHFFKSTEMFISGQQGYQLFRIYWRQVMFIFYLKDFLLRLFLYGLRKCVLWRFFSDETPFFWGETMKLHEIDWRRFVAFWVNVDGDWWKTHVLENEDLYDFLKNKIQENFIIPPKIQRFPSLPGLNIICCYSQWINNWVWDW